MTAAEKKKYIMSKIMGMLEPYGYFTRYGAIWRYSLSGKYIICISCDLLSGGQLKEITVEAGTFYAYKIEREKYIKNRLSLGTAVPLGFYLRNEGIRARPINSNLSFENQWEAYCPYFKKYLLPHLPTSDDPQDSIIQIYSLMKMLPMFSNNNEIAYGYLGLGQKEKALSVIDSYLNDVKQRKEEILKQSALTQLDNSYLALWDRALQASSVLQDSIRKGDESVYREMMDRESRSLSVCKEFFHIQ